MANKIRVGIIGTGGWARYGHIPTLQALDAFEVVALSGRNLAKVRGYADEFGIAHAFDDAEQLINHPEVDLVVVLAPTPEHGRLSKKVVEAGKDVYSEWPLSTNTAESERVLALAQTKGVTHVVGLQRRFSPSSRYWHDLVRQGYVGKLRAVRMSVGVEAFSAVMPEAARWAVDPDNFTHLLPVYGGHFFDMLFHGLEFPEKLVALSQNQLPVTTIKETGEQIPYAAANEVLVIGTFPSGGTFTLQLEGGQRHPTGLQIEITGTDGVLRILNPRGFQNVDDGQVYGMKDGATAFVELPVPGRYNSLPVTHLDASAQDVAYLYDAYARSKTNGDSDVTTFEDALRMHRLLDRVVESSAANER